MENTTTLNDLIEINNDRVEGYEKAITQIKDEDSDLKEVFSDMVAQSQRFSVELKKHVFSEGNDPAEGTTNRGKIYRVWMDVKAVFTGKDRKATLSSCEFGEDAAQRAYATALEDNDLKPEVKHLLKNKKSLSKHHMIELKFYEIHNLYHNNTILEPVCIKHTGLFYLLQ